MSENKYKKLFNNSILFAIGNFGSKFITFFMLPLYTYQLSQADYGITDLIQTTVSLLIPVVTLSVFDAVLRFAMDKEYDRKKVFSIGVYITFVSSLCLSIIGLICLAFNEKYVFYVIIILIIQNIQVLFSQFVKAIQQVKLFAVNGILLSFLTALFNILFLLVFKMELDGYILALFLANLISNLYLFFKGNLFQYIEWKNISKALLVDMTKYSTPLIPNSIAWWVTNAVSRYFILIFLGPSANGIFAVANKIPTLLSVLNSVFFQSWQMSAIEENNSGEKEHFYSTVYNLYYQFLFISTSGILLILKPIIIMIVSPEFYISWKYVPLLLLSVLYSSLSGFFGQFYIAAKKTKGLLSTTILGAIINVLMNVILIPLFGLQGAALSSAISFFVIWIFRIRDTKKIVKININNKNTLFNHVFLIFQILSLYVLDGNVMFLSQILLFFIVLIVNRETIIKIIKKIVN
ncbi:polysaccharide biosynthesis C-terminal domain-containing protein [Enterococcus saccharolyticus]|uniref:lipopolysaccharide biosynthesis protein n=1 Tax=Enterococcus saccharolyticus TaxID=41997 RepID=UPI001E3224E7|nr:polysaccharide biosynthesis C-terminal domain-containing protein [Enterococcus saccharolyticus]MCD5003724.1 polysaccharide biosynthesis C-terminal domain-containing protein [Enterococcus saccharolyticus]